MNLIVPNYGQVEILAFKYSIKESFVFSICDLIVLLVDFENQFRILILHVTRNYFFNSDITVLE